MNEKTIKTSEALTDMDDTLVSEAANAGGRKRSAWRIAIPAAAAAAVIACAAIVLPGLLAKKPDDAAAYQPAPTERDIEAAANFTEAPAPVTEAPAPVTEQPVWGTVEPVMTAPPAPAEPQVFDNVVSLKAAVASGAHTEGPDVLGDLSKIYMPVLVPYGAELEEIAVTEESVAVTYRISPEYGPDIDEDEEDYPDRFVLIWRRDWQPGSAGSLAESLDAELGCGDLHCKDGFWLFGVNGWLERMAVWEKDGEGFELIVPGTYPEDSDIIGFTALAKVSLSEAEAYDPEEGFDSSGYMHIMDNGFGSVPVVTFAYGTTCYQPEDGGEGRMLRTDGMGFIAGIPESEKGYDRIMRYFPQVGYKFEPALAENVRIVRIDVYHPITLEPIELDITLDELHDIAEGKVSPDMEDLIFGDCCGCVLVDTVIEHRGAFIEELGEYEIDAYHCGFIIDCGY